MARIREIPLLFRVMAQIACQTREAHLGKCGLKPEEVMNLDERLAISFVQGLPPITTRLERYYERRVGQSRFQGISTALGTILMLALGTLAAMAATHFARSGL
jgi:hypothetical protein